MIPSERFKPTYEELEEKIEALQKKCEELEKEIYKASIRINELLDRNKLALIKEVSLQKRSEELEKEVERLKQNLPSRQCSVCKKYTEYCCADCRIDLKIGVYICGTPECRIEHERVCAHELQNKIESLQKRIEELDAEINGKGGHKFLADGLRKRIADLEALGCHCGESRRHLMRVRELEADIAGQNPIPSMVLVNKKDFYNFQDLSTLCDELAGALEFTLGREVFPKGVTEADKETEAFTRVKEALAKYTKFKEGK